MRVILFLLCIVNISAMELEKIKKAASDSDNIHQLCWYLNGFVIKDHPASVSKEIPSIALETYNFKALQLLHAHGWNINQQIEHPNFHGSCFYTAPLIHSCFIKNVVHIVWLTYLGADLNEKNILNHNVALFATLIDYGVINATAINRQKELIQFLLSQNAQRYSNESLWAISADTKQLIDGKKRPPIPNEAREIMLGLYREKKNIARTLRNRELGIK